MKLLESLTLKQKKVCTFLGVFLILLTMFLIAIFSSKGAFGIPGDSGTTDEVAHIPSGYSYIKYLDFRLNPEHPPLAKALAGIPLAFQSNIKGPKDDWSWNSINQWEAGWYMLYEAGNDPANVLFWARLPMILLTLGLGLFLFIWARELYGRKVGLLVLLLFSFYPDIIAHGRLVTTDIAAAFGFVITVYYFDKAIKEKTMKSSVFAALAFALAQLLKFSSFLLFGVLLILVIIRSWQERKFERENFFSRLFYYFKKYLLVSVLSVLFVWIAYIPFTWNTPPSIEHALIETNLTSDARTLPLRNFVHLFENNVILRGLGHYVLGIFLVIGRVAGGNATFIMGHLSDKSISWFFPVAWLIKTPITIIVLFFASLFVYFKRKDKTEKEAWTYWMLLTPFLVYWAFTLKGSLNIGIRHLMPTVPFVLLIIGYALHRIFIKQNIRVYQYIASILILFMIGSTISYYPSFIGYFNEFVPRDQRYNYLVDSSLDWGQDVLRLKKYIDDNQIKSIKVDYFGGSVPSYYIPQAKEWHSSYGPTTGWLAVSATFYQSSKLYGEKESKWSYGWLDNFKPKAIIGGSILIFNITPEDLKSHPPQSSYPILKIDFPGSIKGGKVGL